MSTERLMELARIDLSEEEIDEVKEMRTTVTGKAVMANALIIVVLFCVYTMSANILMFWLALGLSAIYIPIKRAPYNYLLGKQHG